MHTDGVINLGFWRQPEEGPPRLYLSWLIAYLINTLQAVDNARTTAGVPDCEYAIEVFLSGSPPPNVFDLPGTFDSSLGQLADALTLPRVQLWPHG